jgi:hypothetical protein
MVGGCSSTSDCTGGSLSESEEQAMKAMEEKHKREWIRILPPKQSGARKGADHISL